MKCGAIRAVSIGFLPSEWDHIDDGGIRFIKWSLLELSLCAVPANPSAVITERSFSAPGFDAGQIDDILSAARATLRRLDGTAGDLAHDEGEPRTIEDIRKYHGLEEQDPRVIVAEARFRLARYW